MTTKEQSREGCLLIFISFQLSCIIALLIAMREALVK